MAATPVNSSKSGYIATFALLAVVAAACWLSRPFPDTIVSKSVSVYPLSTRQRMNIEQAGRVLNGKVILPGERFSFNGVVGPRTVARGYVAAPAYVQTETLATVGGGICLVSSCLYQLALETGLRIDERSPHLRPVRTVAPGLDATVWYGQTDLVFTNTTSSPLKIETVYDSDSLRLSLLGNRSQVPTYSLKSHQLASNDRELSVEVLKEDKSGKAIVVSHDIYQLPLRSKDPLKRRRRV
ncbi:MAG TPA: VanW family protein [Chroococcales cyanobacterium]